MNGIYLQRGGGATMIFFSFACSLLLRWHTKNNFVFIYISVILSLLPLSLQFFSRWTFFVGFFSLSLSLFHSPFAHKKEFSPMRTEEKPHETKPNATDENKTVRGVYIECASFCRTQVCRNFSESERPNLRKIIVILCNLFATGLSTQTAFSKAIYIVVLQRLDCFDQHLFKNCFKFLSCFASSAFIQSRSKTRYNEHVMLSEQKMQFVPLWTFFVASMIKRSIKVSEFAMLRVCRMMIIRSGIDSSSSLWKHSRCNIVDYYNKFNCMVQSEKKWHNPRIEIDKMQIRHTTFCANGKRQKKTRTNGKQRGMVAHLPKTILQIVCIQMPVFIPFARRLLSSKSLV